MKGGIVCGGKAGIERVACLKYGITVRDLYTNDYRFLRNFDRKEI